MADKYPPSEKRDKAKDELIIEIKALRDKFQSDKGIDKEQRKKVGDELSWTCGLLDACNPGGFHKAIIKIFAFTPKKPDAPWPPPPYGDGFLKLAMFGDLIQYKMEWDLAWQKNPRRIRRKINPIV